MLNSAGQRYGTQLKVFLEKMGWKWGHAEERNTAHTGNAKDRDYQLKTSTHE